MIQNSPKAQRSRFLTKAPQNFQSLGNLNFTPSAQQCFYGLTTLTAADDDSGLIIVDNVCKKGNTPFFFTLNICQSLGHLNVVPTDQQRVIGSPAPAAIRKMNERHRKKKLVRKRNEE